MITGNTLIELGWRPGPELGRALARGRILLSEGNSLKETLTILETEYPKRPPQRQTMLSRPVTWSEAIAAESSEDEENIDKIRKKMDELMRTPVIKKGAVMPDACPAGMAQATIPVGGVIVSEGIHPGVHSADICCSMSVTLFLSKKETGELLDALMQSTRFGPGGRPQGDRVAHPVLKEQVWSNRFLKDFEHLAEIHMADQGDGNHFAFIGELELSSNEVELLRRNGYGDLAGSLEAVEMSCKALVTHHGSRGLGARVYKRGMDAAIKQTELSCAGVPKAAAWLDPSTPEGMEYWEALQYVGRWTEANHRSIHERFLSRSGVGFLAEFGNEHNFVWKRDDGYYHGKGATPSWNDQKGRPLIGVIPMNMGSSILLVLGSDNDDFCSFAPHGAGRNVSRRQVTRRFEDEEGRLLPGKVQAVLEDTTKGLDIRWFTGKPDISEAPIAYKSPEQVRNQIEHFNLASIFGEIKPFGCIMAGDPGEPFWMKKRREKKLRHRKERKAARRAIRGGDWEELGDRTQ